MWLYERNLCFKWISRPEPKEDTVLKIDAFLAFSHVDVDLIKEYLDKLEKGPRQYQLRFYQRDWQIGASIPDCILESIECSKRVIILMTNNFVNSSWGMFEFRSAIKATSMDPNKRLLVILYPNVNLDNLEPELKRYMTYNTYLRRDDPQFWRKLMYSMPHKEVQCEQSALTECPAIEESQL
ncbi:protein toll-like [Drosophila innubila]|uniref:protein toll-like n=1 Tax=Drosophila innubila TaxID=198719 RepID=UPI00148C35D0|nr:protein toll-like [Drosophila innubila]